MTTLLRSFLSDPEQLDTWRIMGGGGGAWGPLWAHEPVQSYHRRTQCYI